MASGWQNKLARLSQMGWDEARTRVGQELHKRRDLFRYRLGLSQRHFRMAPAPWRKSQFFFSGDEIAERKELIRTHLPDEAAAIIREADEICAHRFRLLGYENLDYGAEIDWHLDRVHGKRAPLDPWFKIPFLEFATVGDHKVIWELNRHQHLVTLAKAWLLSEDEKYVRELIAQWHGWTKANPYPLGINWASTLEVGFRALSWIWVDHLLAQAPGHAAFQDELVPALALHGRYIERFLSTYFSPNTHLLGEALALFFLGTLYPQFPRAALWQEIGLNILLQEAQRQVRPDGVYFEQSLYYHVYALDMFLHARLLAARNGIEVPGALDAVLERMLGLLQALSQAGSPEGFGDDDGGRLFNPRRNHTEHMTDPLALGVLTYHLEDLPAARLTEESIWLFGPSATTTFSGTHASPPPQAAAFPDGGLYVLTDSQPYPQQMVIDAGPMGEGRCGHGHADALSLRLIMAGRRWLVDSGSGVYISAEPADRNAFRGTTAHNTMRVDGMDQAVPEQPFSWSAIPTTLAEKWIAGKTFNYFAGSHDGYARLADPVIHRRAVLKISDGPCLVRDVALGHGEHELEVLWHFAADLEVRDTGSGITVVPASADLRHSALNLIAPQGTTWQTEITRCLLSPVYGAFQPAPLVRCHARVALPAETAAALVPCFEAGGKASKPSLANMRSGTVQVYELTDENETHGFFFALDKRPWSFGPWSSDAELLYCRIRDEKLAHLVVIGGTHVAWQGRQLLRAPGPSDFFEWWKDDAVMNAEPEPFSISSLLGELAGIPVPSPDTGDRTFPAPVEKH